MTLGRLTDKDKNFGPFTWGISDYKHFGIKFATSGGDDNDVDNHFKFYVGKFILRIKVPTRFKPWTKWIDTSKYEWSTNPAGGYWQKYPKEYGFSCYEGLFSISYGPYAGDSEIDKSWSKFLPWTQWRFVRESLYDTQGRHYFTNFERRDNHRLSWEVRNVIHNSCPKMQFEIEDTDGTIVQATTKIEEREWQFGEGWFKWLSWFRKSKIIRQLDIEFDQEVGPEKGSWKGGLIGTSIVMNEGELPEEAFKRYCDEEHRARHSKKYKVKYIGIKNESN